MQGPCSTDKYGKESISMANHLYESTQAMQRKSSDASTIDKVYTCTIILQLYIHVVKENLKPCNCNDTCKPFKKDVEQV